MHPLHLFAYAATAAGYVLAVLLLNRWLQQLWRRPVTWYRDLAIAVPLTLLLPGGLVCMDYRFPMLLVAAAGVIQWCSGNTDIAELFLHGLFWGYASVYLGTFATLRGGRWLLDRKPAIAGWRVSRLAQRLAPRAVPALALVGLAVFLGTALRFHHQYPPKRQLVSHPTLPRTAEITLHNQYHLNLLPVPSITVLAVYDHVDGETRTVFTGSYRRYPFVNRYDHDTAIFSRDGDRLFISDNTFPGALTFVDIGGGSIRHASTRLFRFAGSFADLILIYTGDERVGQVLKLYDFSGDPVSVLQLDGGISDNWESDFTVTGVSPARMQIDFRARHY